MKPKPTDIVIANTALRYPVGLSDVAVELRKGALEAAALVGRVSTPEENEKAVEAQAACSNVERLIERGRLEVTKPILAAQRAIKAKLDEEREELLFELKRLSKLIGDYQALQDEKARAEENARKQELTDLERRREDALKAAKTPAEADEIREVFDELAAAKSEAPAPEPVRAKGQVVSREWVVDTLNEWQLAKARPDLVRKIEFDMRGIKAALARGESLPGVKAHEETKATVRSARRLPHTVIEV